MKPRHSFPITVFILLLVVGLAVPAVAMQVTGTQAETSYVHPPKEEIILPPEPASPMEESGLITFIFNTDFVSGNDADPRPGIIDLSMTREELDQQFTIDQETGQYRQNEVTSSNEIVILRMPRTMYAYFNNDPDSMRISFPADQFESYENLSAFMNKIQGSTGPVRGSTTPPTNVPERGLVLETEIPPVTITLLPTDSSAEEAMNNDQGIRSEESFTPGGLLSGIREFFNGIFLLFNGSPTITTAPPEERTDSEILVPDCVTIQSKMETKPGPSLKHILEGFFSAENNTDDYAAEVFIDGSLDYTFIHKKPYFYKISWYLGQDQVYYTDYIDNKTRWSYAPPRVDILPYGDPHCFPFEGNIQQNAADTFSRDYTLTSLTPQIIDNRTVYVVKAEYSGNKALSLVIPLKYIYIDPDTWMVTRLEEWDAYGSVQRTYDIKNMAL